VVTILLLRSKSIVASRKAGGWLPSLVEICPRTRTLAAANFFFGKALGCTPPSAHKTRLPA